MEKQKNFDDDKKVKKNPKDPRKHPAPGYDETNPKNKKDSQEPPKK